MKLKANRLTALVRNQNTKAGGYYFFGNLFNKGIAFFTVPIFTRLMSTTDYGIVDTYISWVSILSLIVGLSLGSAIRNAHVDYQDDLEGFVSSIFFLSLLNFLVSSGMIISIAHLFLNVDTVLLILCLVQSFMTFVINSISLKYMMDFDYIKRTWLSALPNVIIASLSVIFLLNMTSHKYLGRIIPYVLVTSSLGSYYLIRSFWRGKKFFQPEYWRYALSLSLPLIFHGLSITVLATSDRTMITVFRSAAETGVYGLAYKLSMVAAVVTTSLESVWIPWFTKKMQKGDKATINQNARMYIEVVLVVVLGILLVSPEVLMLMAPREYWSGKILIPPVLLASFFIFLYSISVDLEYYYKSTKVMALNTIIAASVNVVLNLFLVPVYGALAAAYTTVAAYIVSFGIHYRAARKLDSDLFPFKIYVKPILIVLMFSAATYALMNYALVRWAIAIIGSIFYGLVAVKNDRFSQLTNKS